MEEPEIVTSFRSEGVGVKLGEMGFGLGLDDIHCVIAVPPETGNSSYSFPALTELAMEGTTIMTAVGSRKAEMVKQETLDSKCWPNSSSPAFSNENLNPTKRKRRDKQLKESNKNPGENEAIDGRDEKLPYVHVRARRGQAIDSHTLAERARREKINARMKLLQNLVPGCNKISGTALVLDEIINHLQSLQRQVEFLSMSLASVDTRLDFNLDCLLATESGISMENSNPGLFVAPMWPDNHQMSFIPQHHYQQPVQPSWGREEDPVENFVVTENPSNSGKHTTIYR